MIFRALAVAALLMVPSLAAAAEITVLCPRGTQHVVALAAEDFQRATRHNVWLVYGTSDRVLGRAANEAADVIVAPTPGVADLETKGVVQFGSRVALGRVGIGVAVKKGAKAPDVSTAPLLRRALLEATSIAYADPADGGESGRHVARVIEAIGIAPLIATKVSVFPDGLRALESVAAGRTELGIAPVSEILGVDGLALAGPLPDGLQQVLDYAAGLLIRSAAPDVAKAFLQHLKSAEGRSRLTAGGFTPAD
jgi:molybdate transport system substrate-binding protein